MNDKGVVGMINEQFLNKVLHGDCFEWMEQIEDKSVDMILCDLPYGTTANKWDTPLDIEALWNQYNRVIKDDGAICLFSSQPFTTTLINSNPKMFRYEIIWDKTYGTDFQLANKKPMKAHENILLFYKKQPTYNPQKTKREKPIDTRNWKQDKRNQGHNNFHSEENIKKKYDHKMPITVLTWNPAVGETNNTNKVHPTQKPLYIMEWLINTYTNEGETVLDNCVGSGTTAIAAINTNRNFIGMEKELEYCEVANKRIKDTLNPKA